MLETVIKVVVTSVLVIAVSEVAKRSVTAGAILASLPLTSLLAFGWLWAETRDTERIAALSHGIFWLVLPSLALFLTLPLLLRKGFGFVPSLLLASGVTVLCYFAMLWLLKRIGIEV